MTFDFDIFDGLPNLTATTTGRSTDNIDYDHMFYDTPVDLIWKVRSTILKERNVKAILKAYARNPNCSPRYYGSGQIIAADLIHKNKWYEKCLINKRIDIDLNDIGAVNQTAVRDALKANSAVELAFSGFRVIGVDGWKESNEALSSAELSKIITHDIPKCDFKFKLKDIESSDVRDLLRAIKSWIGGRDLYLFKTTNSFHMYGAKLLNASEITNWLKFLKRIDIRYPGVIDSKWLDMNVAEQPLRISQTIYRGLPYLYCVL